MGIKTITMIKFKNIFWNIWYYIRLSWYFIEIIFTKIQLFFGYRKDKSYIPVGHYCYEWDEERNKKEPTNGYWILSCKYYRSMKGHYAGCTYVGFIGFDSCLGDQCKVCGENYDDRDPIIIERENKIEKLLNRYEIKK